MAQAEDATVPRSHLPRRALACAGGETRPLPGPGCRRRPLSCAQIASVVHDSWPRPLVGLGQGTGTVSVEGRAPWTWSEGLPTHPPAPRPRHGRIFLRGSTLLVRWCKTPWLFESLDRYFPAFLTLPLPDWAGGCLRKEYYPERYYPASNAILSRPIQEPTDSHQRLPRTKIVRQRWGIPPNATLSDRRPGYRFPFLLSPTPPPTQPSN